MKKLWSAYLVDTEKYSLQKLFDMEADSAADVLVIARERLAAKGLPISPPYGIDVRRVESRPMDMRRRYRRIYGDPADMRKASSVASHPGRAYTIWESHSATTGRTRVS